MNWRLIFSLSLFGLAMAFATVYLINSKAEPFFWLPVFIICACFIAMYAPGKYFLHGFYVSILNYIWIALVHILLAATYLAHDARAAALYAKMNMEGLPVARGIFMTSFVFGIISGVFIGLFSTIATKFIKK